MSPTAQLNQAITELETLAVTGLMENRVNHQKALKLTKKIDNLGIKDLIKELEQANSPTVDMINQAPNLGYSISRTIWLKENKQFQLGQSDHFERTYHV